jgi:FixJ family two-component response regulator
MKKPPTVFIVDNRPAITSSLEATVKTHCFLVQCYSSAAQFIADQNSSSVGCVLVDPLRANEGGAVLRWLHESGSLLSVALISGLMESAGSASSESPSAPIVLQPHEVSALLTMVTDGLAGSISRHVIRDRTRA